MAEIALLATLIPKLVFLLDGEVKLHRNTRKDLESIKRELECMKDFLMAVDGSEDETWENDVWVSQVREAAFESEDIVDEFLLCFARDYTDSGSSTSRSCGLISMVKNGRAHRSIASRMKDIKSKFLDIREGNKRYRTESFKPVIPSAGRRLNNHKQNVHNLSNDELVGTEVHEANLVNMLLEAENYSVDKKAVSVCGMGGVGKTSLVKKVYDNNEVRKLFQGQVWITVSRMFEPENVLKDIIRSLSEDEMRQEPEEFGKMNRRQMDTKILLSWSRDELQQKATQLLMQNKYMIVFDDVWGISAWNFIKQVLRTKSTNSQVVITTRNKATALAACSGQANWIYDLEPLSFDVSLDLFFTKIFGRPASCPAHLNDVSKNIVKKCAGLPLAIVAIAGVLVSKDVTSHSDEWGRIDLSLREEMENMQKVLSLSYNDLPFEVKPCFLYLSIFPEDYLMQKMRLIRLWIAEGFVKRKDGMSVVEMAESYFDELINRNLIQAVDRTGDGRVETCRIHDLLRDMIVKKAMDQKFAALATEYSDIRSLKTRRLSLSSDLRMVQQQSQLRSILLFSVEQPVTKSSMPTLFSKNLSFRLLTVLDLKGTNLDTFPSAIVKLINLKYLNLSHTDVREVPSSIGRLRYLEILDLRSTLVPSLPLEILKLQRLRDLLAYRIFGEKVHGVKVPSEILALRSLENLCFLDAGEYRDIAAEDIARLWQLCITNLSEKNAGSLCSHIKHLRYLRVLSISSESEAWSMDLQSLVSPSNTLRRTYLTGKLESLPQWIETLHNLVTIHLKSSKLRDDPTEILGYLPNLVHVELSESHTGVEMRFKSGHFQKLKVLSLSDFTCLVEVVFEDESMPNLEKLCMANNNLVKTIPSGIENLPRMRELNLVDMPSELSASIQGSGGQEGTEYHKIKHVRYVNWVHKVGNAWKRARIVPSLVTRYNDEDVDVMKYSFAHRECLMHLTN